MSERSTKRLKILFVWGRMSFPFFIGGDGLLVHHALTGGVQQHDWECQVLGTFDGGPSPKPFKEIIELLNVMEIPHQVVINNDLKTKVITYHLTNYSCSMVAFSSLENALRNTIHKFSPDIILTAEEDAEIIIDIAKKMGIPSVLLLFHAGWSKERIIEISTKTDIVIFDSNFLCERYQKRLLCPSYRIYPPFDWEQWKVKRSSYRYISMVNPTPEKGIDIFLAIAQTITNNEFLLQGGWHPLNIDIKNITNITYRARNFHTSSHGMNFFMENTKILLVPSQIEDALPTIAIQALHNGIPVIGSRKGGIPEVIGNGGIIVEEYDQPNAWVSAIQYLNSNAEQYKLMSERAYISAERFSYKNEIRHLDLILRKLFD
jgi:glycosyltransferase involved in cell wall biosynthesis